MSSNCRRNFNPCSFPVQGAQGLQGPPGPPGPQGPMGPQGLPGPTVTPANGLVFADFLENTPAPPQILSAPTGDTIVNLPGNGPLNNIITTGNGLIITTPGLYEIDYSVTVNFNRAITESALSIQNVTARLTANGSLIPGSRSNIILPTAIEDAMVIFPSAGVLTAPTILEVDTLTAIQIVVTNNSSTAGTQSPLSTVRFASLQIIQII